MTVQEEQAVIGRMIQERKALRRKLIVLLEEAQRVGKKFKEIGIHFYGGAAQHYELTPEQVDLLDAQKALELNKDLRETTERLDSLNEKLKEFD